MGAFFLIGVPMDTEKFLDRIKPLIGDSFNRTFAFIGTNTVDVLRATLRCLPEKIFITSTLEEAMNEELDMIGIQVPYSVLEEGRQVPENCLVIGAGSTQELFSTLAVGHKREVLFGWQNPFHSMAAYYGDIDARGELLDYVTKYTTTNNVFWQHDVTDLLLYLVKSVVFRHSKERRKFTYARFIESGHNVLLRTGQGNPYAVWSTSLQHVMRSEDIQRQRPPAPKPYRVLLIGCGTGSLYADIVANKTSAHLAMVDCKPFSEFNLVRQRAHQDDVGGEVKSIALMKMYRSEFPDGTSAYISSPMDAPWPAYANGRFSAHNLAIEHERDVRLLYAIEKPDVVVIAMGESHGVNHLAAKVAREMGIPHVIPTALPGASYIKVIVVGKEGTPCYSCYQGPSQKKKGSPKLTTEARELFYGGTQPATMFETLPAAHLIHRVVEELMQPPVYGKSWVHKLLDAGKGCILLANETHDGPDGQEFLYCIDHIGGVATFGVRDLRDPAACIVCGRLNGDRFLRACSYCGKEEAVVGDFCSRAHETLHTIAAKKREKMEERVLTGVAGLGEESADSGNSQGS